MNNSLIQKYFWLIQTFTAAGERGLSLGQIQDKWENRWDEVYTRRSFCNHRNQIEEIFGIRISCDRSSNIYFIDENYSYTEEDNKHIKWMIDSMTVHNLSELSRTELYGRIALEDTPSGKGLIPIVDAMQNNLCLIVEYKKYSAAQSSFYTIRPYAVKESARRWYLVGYCEEKTGVRVYALDRIQQIETTDKTFRLPHGFDVEELFDGCYSTYLPDKYTQPREVIFKASKDEVKYLDDLPIHHSQAKVEVFENGDATYRIKVNTRDFKLKMDFLAMGSNVEICSPEDFRQEVADELRKTLQKYE